MRAFGVLAIATCMACGSAPLVKGAPQTPWVFHSAAQASIDKVDLLLAIDNSSSMADKQKLFADAIPALNNRLLNPNCVDANGLNPVPGDNSGCTTIPKTYPEFPAVHDLHVGIVTSSLGGATPDASICTLAMDDATHQDDMGHLINRTLANALVQNAKPLDNNGGNFLAWLPSANPKNTNKPSPNVTPYTEGNAEPFENDLALLVTGAGQTGCGLEAQLESWYRFLIAPDPYAQLVFSNDDPPKASYDGVDSTLLKMRYDFLRPDSLVAIIQLTDEEDSWSDPMWLGGYGWTSRTQNFPGGPGDSSGVGPRGTSECDVDPNDPDCTSCAFPTSSKPKSGTLIGDDPNCQSCAPGETTCAKPGWYSAATPSTPITAADGLNVRYGSQYTRARYGLDSQYDVQRYIDALTTLSVADRDHEETEKQNCTNPLFAAELPDGSDTTPATLCNLTLGSRTPSLVYYAILGGVPNDIVGDWNAMLGPNGIDPRMIESVAPRAGVSGDWNTLESSQGIDLEYACTFALDTPHDCSAGNDPSCECNGASDGPPLCDPQNPTTQIRGKAYPTIRELRVAQGLGAQGIAASICPTDASGYAPAMNRIVDAARGPLSGACFSEPFPNACELVMEMGTADQMSACDVAGLAQPSSDLIAAWQATFAAFGNLDTPAVCVVDEVDCAGTAPGWCVKRGPVCAMTIGFSSAWTAPQAGLQTFVACPD